MPIARSRTGGGKKAGKATEGGFVAVVARFWQRSYAADYAGFALLITAYILLVLLVEPFHRMFSLDDIAIQFPHAEVERVPVSYLLVYAGAIPLLVLILWAFIFQSRAHEFHVTILGFIISLILTSFLTDVVKNSVGRPRPDLIARCKPEKDTPEHTLVTIDICTETDHHTLHDGWRSFPSGHSSFAFSGLGYLALFFAGQMHVFRPHTDLARVLLTLAPLIGAAMIAISRCEDYRHDVYDVTTGSLLGIFVAYFSYRRYYPGLSSSHCDEPYPSRAETANMNGFAKVRDEEDGIADANTIAMMDLGTGLESGPVRQARGDDGRSSGSRNDIR